MNPITRARALFAALTTSLLLMLTGCGGGSGSSAGMQQPQSATCTDSAGCGMAYIAMTDADGDFLSYTVDVVSLQLKRANGTIVETIPNQMRVDFAQYVDVTEFVTAATTPNGAYVEGTLRLDYSNADVTVEKGGVPVKANVVDANGAPLTGMVDVRVVLDNRNHLVVAPGRPALLTLDFNLAATNTVDLTTTPVTVKARPTLVASLEPIEQKEMRLRGPLVNVDTMASTYTIDVRPFNHLRAKDGRVTIHTTSTTTFEVNGQSSSGAAGLQTLSTAGADTPTLAFGTLSTSDHSFTAARVYAGSSVPGFGLDAVIGTVISRTGDVLTVRGATIIRRDSTNMTANMVGTDDDDLDDDDGDHAIFHRGDVQITLGPNTKVFKDGDATQTFGPQAVSVGQLINVFGTAAQTNSATPNSGSSSSLTSTAIVDATAGRVRMHLTHLFGTVVNSGTGSLTLNLNAINGRPISAFNFAGTGMTPAQDADPTHYEVKTPPVMITQIIVGKPMEVFGFVLPFASAPPDFESKTLVSFGQLRAELGIGWGDTGTATPFSMMDPTSGLVLDMSNPSIGLRHYLHLGFMLIDLKTLSTAPTIVSASGGETMFVVVTPSGINHYSVFGDFVSAITGGLNNSGKMLSFDAEGTFDSATNTLTAKEAVAIIK